MISSKYDAFFLDCDGVILDSNSVKTDAFFELAQPYGKDVANQFVEYHHVNGGISRFEKIKYLYKDILQIKNWHEKSNQSIEKFGQIVKTKLVTAKEAPGLRDFLDKISGYDCYVVSGGMQSELRQIFFEKKLDGYFKGIYGSPDSKYQIVDAILKKMNYKSPLFVGDSKLDYQVADHYGMTFIFLTRYTEFSQWQNFFSEKNIKALDNISEIEAA